MLKKKKIRSRKLQKKVPVPEKVILNTAPRVFMLKNLMDVELEMMKFIIPQNTLPHVMNYLWARG